MNVGIRELKAHLSEYVHRAQAGEVVVVTDRGRPVAELRPCQPVEDDLPEAIRRGIAEGWITPARRRGPLGPSPIALRLPDGLTSEQLLTEDREDRF